MFLKSFIEKVLKTSSWGLVHDILPSSANFHNKKPNTLSQISIKNNKNFFKITKNKNNNTNFFGNKFGEALKTTAT